MRKSRLTKEEALSFLLTQVVVAKNTSFQLDAMKLFSAMSLAAEAESRLEQEQGLIPHEVIEAMAEEFIKALNE